MATVQIPQYKDKVIFYTDNKDQQDYSYSVSSSFKGCLRLSPNEIPNYQDSIDNLLNKDVIQLSDSEGYLLDLKMSSNNIEIGNLFVIGSSSTDNLLIYHKETSINNKTIVINDVNNLPSLVNESFNIDIPVNTNDLPDIDINDTNEDTFILFSESEGNNREFQYSKLNKLINDSILDILLSSQDVPTGSIHWCPVNLEQYKMLLSKSKHNVYSYDNQISDPLVRDYLLCDGRKYFARDFPELSKIIYGEKISYSINDNSLMVRKNISNSNLTFRTPDLRHLFIKSIILDKDESSNEYNITGTYNTDNIPRTVNGSNKSSHSHFIAYGTYNPRYSGKTSFSNVATIQNDESVLLDFNNPAMLILGNHQLGYALGNQYGNYLNKWDESSFMYPGKSGGGNRNYGPLNNNSGTAYFTYPTSFNQNTNNSKATAYRTSDIAYSFVEIPPSDEDIKYNDKEYVDIIIDKNNTLYGKESNPEYFTSLPLIKI